MVETPQAALDIMVPVYNHLELTIPCLNALYTHTRNPFHLIITDFSTDLTPLWLNQFCKEHNNVTYLHYDRPSKGGNEFFNIALEHAKTEFLATIMNSVQVEPLWDIGGLQVMQSNPEVGVVGFKCIFPNGFIESAFIQMNKWLPCDIGRGEPSHRYALIHEVGAVQWAFALLRVKAVKGLLEEDIFHPHVGWDDIDNCFVVKRAGWKIFFCGASVGYHNARATRGNDSAEAAQKNRENGITFYKRWGFWDDFVSQYGEEGSIHSPPKPNGATPKIKAAA